MFRISRSYYVSFTLMMKESKMRPLFDFNGSVGMLIDLWCSGDWIKLMSFPFLNTCGHWPWHLFQCSNAASVKCATCVMAVRKMGHLCNGPSFSDWLIDCLGGSPQSHIQVAAKITLKWRQKIGIQALLHFFRLYFLRIRRVLQAKWH